MSKVKKEQRYIFMIAVLAGSPESLIDMMRYDSCVPASEKDSHKIIALMNGGGDPDDHIITLRRFAPNNYPATEDRWRSFGCHVLTYWNPDATAPTIEELRGYARHMQATKG